MAKTARQRAVERVDGANGTGVFLNGGGLFEIECCFLCVSNGLKKESEEGEEEKNKEFRK